MITSGSLFDSSTAAIILAGGKSHRMGTEKSLLPVNQKPLIQHIYNQLQPLFSTILISSNNPELYKFLNLEIIPDRQPDHGPMMGIATTMEHSTQEKYFVVGCDIPVLNQKLIQKMIKKAPGWDAVVPQNGGHWEPLFAVYNRSALPTMWELLDKGQGKLVVLCSTIRVYPVILQQSEWLKNLNTQEEYRYFLENLQT